MTDMVRTVSSTLEGNLQADAGRPEPPRRVRQGVAIVADALVLTLAASLLFLTNVQIPLWADDHTTLPPVAIVAAWLSMLALLGSYRSAHLHFGPEEYQRSILASTLSAGLVGLTLYLTDLEMSRTAFVLLFALGTPSLLVTRFARRRTLNRLRTRGLVSRRVMLAGNPGHVDELATVLRREKWLGYRIIGALTPTDGARQTGLGLPILGRVDEVASLIDDLSPDTIIFAEGAFPTSSHFRRTAWELERHNIDMVVAPSLTDICAQRIIARPVAGLPLVFVQPPQAIKAVRWAKRAFDIVGSAILLILSAPVLAATALVVKLEDGGPVLFRQTRVGLHGKQFSCLKIRSMCRDAEAKLAALQQSNEGAGPLFKMTHDPRITRAGRFIRRFSIDEIPQFWNVLRGEMSLVGPRPALPTETAQYDFDTSRRLHVRPGLTGLWQVSGRSKLSWEDTVRLDLYYVDNWSLTQDVMLLARTAKAVLGSNGAY